MNKSSQIVLMHLYIIITVKFTDRDMIALQEISRICHMEVVELVQLRVQTNTLVMFKKVMTKLFNFI